MQKLGAGGRQDGRGRASRLGREGGSHGSRATSGMQGGTTEPLLRFTTLRESAIMLEYYIIYLRIPRPKDSFFYLTLTHGRCRDVHLGETRTPPRRHLSFRLNFLYPKRRSVLLSLIV